MKSLTSSLILLLSLSAAANEHRFGFGEEARGTPEGEVEVEQSCRWKSGRRGSSERFNQVQMEQELEYSFTQSFRLSPRFRSRLPLSSSFELQRSCRNLAQG